MKFLIIQTAFIGDVILATPVVEKLHRFFPGATIDFLLRKGNEGLFQQHPYIHEVITWDKKKNKLFNLLKILKKIRSNEYDMVVNLHRFASSGFLTWLSGSSEKIGFDKNPLSFTFSQTRKHEIGNGKHEVERNLSLIEDFTDNGKDRLRLYPADSDYTLVKQYQQKPYVCIAPTSVWFTKQFPFEKWKELICKLPLEKTIYLLGAPSDVAFCERLLVETNTGNVVNLSGKLSFLQSAALMQSATMNYVNDSAPMHMASAMNAPVTAIFCSTIPAFGFGPLSDKSEIWETKKDVRCRPCGLHGYKKCPEGHFECAKTIETNIIDEPSKI